MKKTLLMLSVVALSASLQAQISTYVVQPPELEGALEFTWADDWGQTPDLNDPANLVEGLAVFGTDGTEADSLCCEAFTNASEIAGNIAVVYRGSCNFSLKALNAQNAGAIACVIINNIPGAPVGMGGGTFGGDVTIPVVMISQGDGAMLRPEIEAGNVILRIGSVLGLFPYNLSIDKSDVALSEFSALPAVLATDDTEFSVPMGAWVHNFGSLSQDGIVLTSVVTQDGTEVYNNTSDPVTIPTNDSLYLALPTFTQDGYSGYYEVTYTASSPNEDDFPSLNVYSYNFLIDSLYSFANIDPATNTPVPQNHYRPTDAVDSWASCMHFRNPNASRVLVQGIYTSASKSAGASMDGEVLEIFALEWNDVFSTYTDATFTSIAEIASGEYFYTEDLGSQVIYVPFFENVYLEDNKRYLFCAFTPNADVFIGYDETRDYTSTQEIIDQPISLINFPYPGGQWGDFGADIVSGIGVRMVSIEVGIEDRDRVEITPFPNPTNDFIRIPVTGMAGAATLQVFDLAGAKISEQRVSVGGQGSIDVNLNGVSNGTYVFQLNFEDGKHSSFRVVVAK